MIFIDQLHRQVDIPYPPTRIISLVPSQTELLFDLGLEDKIVGITKFCVHPKEKVKKVFKVGGTKNFHFDKIHQLHPDLIIANKEENYKEGVEQLAEKYPVWISDICTIEDALQMILHIGLITQTFIYAEKLAENIRTGLEKLKGKYANQTVTYLIWKDPYMVAGKDTFINSVLKELGFINVFGDVPRYPQVSLVEIAQKKSDYVFFSSEPYPFKEKHLHDLQQFLPKSKLKLVNGEMFSWYGSRLLKAIDYFKHFL